jgi:hypothetical protein
MVCPVDCIPLNPEWIENTEQLLSKYHRLQAAPSGDQPHLG